MKKRLGVKNYLYCSAMVEIEETVAFMKRDVSAVESSEECSQSFERKTGNFEEGDARSQGRS